MAEAIPIDTTKRAALVLARAANLRLAARVDALLAEVGDTETSPLRFDVPCAVFSLRDVATSLREAACEASVVHAVQLPERETFLRSAAAAWGRVGDLATAASLEAAADAQRRNQQSALPLA